MNAQDSESSPALSFDVRLVAHRAKSSRILVVGDIMLDHYILGHCNRISPEAPVPVIEHESEHWTLGGAGNVARNLRALGAAVDLIGVTGKGDEHKCVCDLMEAEGLDPLRTIQEPDRVTTVKTRVLSNRQQVVRIDRETTGDVSDEATESLFLMFRAYVPGAAAVLIADYGKGVVTASLLNRIKTMCRGRGVWLGMDPKPVRPLPLIDLKFLKPNLREARILADAGDDCDVDTVASSIIGRYAPDTLLITLGQNGMLLCSGDDRTRINHSGKDVVDVCGAGDTVFAAYAMATVAGLSPVESAHYASIAASIAVSKVGPAVVTPCELSAAVDRVQRCAVIEP